MKRGRDSNVLLQVRQVVCSKPVESYPMNVKRRRPLATEDFEQRLGPNKRPATFDLELERMHKRLRATVPTAANHCTPHTARGLFAQSILRISRRKKKTQEASRTIECSMPSVTGTKHVSITIGCFKSRSCCVKATSRYDEI